MVSKRASCRFCCEVAMRPPRILPVQPMEFVLASPFAPITRGMVYHEGTGFLYFGVQKPPMGYRFVQWGGVLAVAALWVVSPLQEMGGVLDEDAFGIVYLPPALGRILSPRVSQIPLAVSVQPRLDLPWTDSKIAANSSAWRVETWTIQAPTWQSPDMLSEELWAENWETHLYNSLSPKS